jgi:hypothetical protein
MIVTVLFLRNLGEFIPNFQPRTVVLVDTLSSNLNLDVADESMSEGVGPRNVVGLGSGEDGSEGESRELYL